MIKVFKVPQCSFVFAKTVTHLHICNVSLLPGNPHAALDPAVTQAEENETYLLRCMRSAQQKLPGIRPCQSMAPLEHLQRVSNISLTPKSSAQAKLRCFVILIQMESVNQTHSCCMYLWLKPRFLSHERKNHGAP